MPQALILAFVVAFLCVAPPALAEIKPEEVAVIAARGNEESLGLARYYCERRGVPLEHICAIEVPAGEVLKRDLWASSVRPAIQEWIRENDPDREIRCLVTTWGIPLKIGPAKPSSSLKRYSDYLDLERGKRLARLEQVATGMRSIAGGDVLDSPSGNAGDGNSNADSLTAAKNQVERELKAAQERLQNLPKSERQTAARQLQQMATVAGGMQVLIQGLGQRLRLAETSGQTGIPAIKEQFDLLRGSKSALLQTKDLLEQQPSSIHRDQLVVASLEQVGGLIATIEWLDKQRTAVRRNETGAAFDSELSLVLWQDDYELLRWQPNYLRQQYASSAIPEAYRTLIVGRIDASTLELARGLIDQAIAVEERGGLDGRVYLDARGLAAGDEKPNLQGSYVDYDKSLVKAAKILESLSNADGNPRFNVTLDQQPSLFLPGQCPDAALYCGWYSLAKYVDAFDWKPGAIAYHMASAEAATLKEIDSQVWCKRLIEDGVCVTLGPVYEPYLIAFPRPDEFLALLVQGVTVGEAYCLAARYNSWMMSLIGDPLYTPYASP